MSDTLAVLSILKKELIFFMDELIEMYPGETDFLVIRFFMDNQVPVLDMMNYIIDKILPLEHYIVKRDSKFFLENQVLFEGLQGNEGKVNYFKEMWASETLQEEDREMMWTWFEHFVSIAKKYKHLNHRL